MKYVVFAGPSGRGTIPAIKTIGYLESLVDREILANLTQGGEIWKPEDINLWFYGDEKIKEVLAEMDLPEKYMAIRAEVLDEAKLQQETFKFCKRYELDFRIYESVIACQTKE